VADRWARGHNDGRWGSNGLNHSRIQIVQKQSNISKFGPIRKVLFVLGKIEIKYGFEDIEEINNFLHRNFLRFGTDLELKFREFSLLEFDRI
jgi:hypothetical protein